MTKFYFVQYQNPCVYYPSPSSWEAYRDWRLTINFELWVEIFCVPICFHMRIPVCLSVCTWENKSLWLRQYHYNSNCTSMKRSSRAPQHGNPKSWIYFKKLEIDKIEFWPYVLRVSVLLEKKSPWLHLCQSYISNNWYINGKVFTGTTTWKHK